MADEASQYAQAKQYELAGQTYNEVAALEEIHAAVCRRQWGIAQRLVDDLDTAVRDEIPKKLYERINR